MQPSVVPRLARKERRRVGGSSSGREKSNNHSPNFPSKAGREGPVGSLGPQKKRVSREIQSGLQPVLESELLENMDHVLLGRRLADAQPGGDFLVRVSFHQQGGHLHL